MAAINVIQRVNWPAASEVPPRRRVAAHAVTSSSTATTTTATPYANTYEITQPGAGQQLQQHLRPSFISGPQRPRGLPAAAAAAAARRNVSCGALISYVEVTSGSDYPEDLSVEVHPSEAAVGDRICQLVVQAARTAVSQRGVFFLAIPGGSVLKMCGGLVGQPMPWDRTFLFYVNHKCVPPGDKSSTHQKALDLFLTRVGAPLAQVAALQGGSDPVVEAREYESRLRQVAVQYGMDLTSDVVPRFDLMLLGMGADGHVGSLYPGRPETSITGPGAPLVLPVDKKQPPSITLSLPVMCAAKQVVVAMTGGSKAEAVRSALQVPDSDLPARLVRPVEGGSAVWIMDAPAAARLDVAGGARALLAADLAARGL
ncbi:hypothetical protein VOLCADRAFT_73437 [Volvox carteri f. nagariensis]|uniref:Glucosamine/galactosamine-6-phosphate isomerase domain-containing protein n=1 Tax=Volvox carteri f. nagariensis TaxID=3068 RepID=D8TNJ0_VOLCA|nr:uncharacterized protein VOLCADRAFT_73437 [Volvox carteri f. nagariensis]EFJ50850.1 hypothetical protein VOLCADRAFT_73437 [Volvox carteri f. nagariensis]|eukprot:XP_002947862.1 hypothetical protein VOLCADRAFT_73437 [Volvox carteri f. nagariensis]